MTSSRTSHRSLLSGNLPVKQGNTDNCNNSQTVIVISSSSSVVVVENKKRKAAPLRETPRKRRRSSNDRSIIVISSSSSEPGSRKRKASGGGETSSKRPRVSEPDQSPCSSSSPDPHTNKSDFEAKYLQLQKIGAGGFGLVYAGKRVTDSLPVAIKYVRDSDAENQLKEHALPSEVKLTIKAGGGPESVGKCASVALLDWYYFDGKLVLVLERPAPCMNLFGYMRYKGGSLTERDVKNLMAQLVEAAVDLQQKGVFHRDIKFGNTLIETGSLVPRLRLIDFGCSTCHRTGFYKIFSGTMSLAPPEWFKYRRYKAETTTVWQMGAIMYNMLHGCFFDTRSYLEGWTPVSSKLSLVCRDFLEACLTKKYKKRATLEDLLQHPWLQ